MGEECREIRISINCPSYRRPKVKTLKYLSSCQVWVAESEYEDYLNANKGFEENIISVPNQVQGNLCRIRNYILDKELQDNDIVLIVDDDLSGIYRFEPGDRHFGYEELLVSEDELYEMLAEYSDICREMGFLYWGIQINADRICYRHATPFSTVSYIGGPFQVFLKGNELRYDERLPLKEDYDMTLQNCNTFRGCLRVNKYHYRCQQAEQSGGCATYRNYEREKNQLELLQKKWGKDIVKIDTSLGKEGRIKKEKAKFDFNPIIHVPIKGV